MMVVGPSLTRMKASDDVNAAGATVAQTFRPRSCVNATRMGTMMLAVTVLLENNRCSDATANTMTNGWTTAGTTVIWPSSTHASQRAAPVWNTTNPSDSPATIS